MKLSQLPKGAYLHRYKPIVFNSGPVMAVPQRKGEELDTFDIVFSSKEEYESWYKSLVIGLAELDQCLNYCKHFTRIKGNEGLYIRDGKEYPVNGTWCGIHDYGRGESGKFFEWVIQNFGENWYVLMDRYRISTPQNRNV
jgi:hypothetical protein